MEIKYVKLYKIHYNIWPYFITCRRSIGKLLVIKSSEYEMDEVKRFKYLENSKEGWRFQEIYETRDLVWMN